MRLGDLVVAKTNFPDADFWLIRCGDAKQVGRPTREYNPEHIGIRVVNTDVLDSRYLFYMLQYLWSNGVFQKMAKGTLRLVNIKIEDILSIPISTS